MVFLHEYDAKTSAWVRGHEKGIEALKAEFGDRLLITNRENVSPEVDAEQILEEVAHDNADVVFTTSIRMRTACLKVAAQHPKTKFLNCCLNTPHPLVRTYYPRTYEVNYLLGMLAGILSKTDRVGYVAANPVYGVPAAVNAFARGLRAVRPDAHVVLRWACAPVEGQPLNFSDRKDITLLYARSSSGKRAVTGTMACADACRTAACSRWLCRCGSGKCSISASSAPSSTAHGGAKPAARP